MSGAGERAFSGDVSSRILDAAVDVLAVNPSASIDVVIDAAGVSRATFYRHFHSRRELLAALDIQPDPDARQRILGAAIELIGRDGLRGMSMDELATSARVSRASVYRLFPGKAALFDTILAENSPFEAIEDVFARMGDRPPAEVLPAVARAVATVAAPRVGLLRSIFFEVTSQTPDALEGAEPRLRQVLGTVGAYIAGRIAAGQMRPMHPLLAAQLFMGPIVFHLVSRAEADRLGLLDLSLEQSIDQLCQATLLALTPQGGSECTGHH